MLAQPFGLYPSRLWVKKALCRCRGHPGQCVGGLAGRDQRFRQRVVGHEALLAARLFLAQGQLHHAAGLPERRLLWPRGRESAQPALAVEQPRQVEAALQVGFHRKLHVQRPLPITRAARAGLLTLQHRYLAAAPCQGSRHAAPGHACANHHDVLRAKSGRWRKPRRPLAAVVHRRCGNTASQHFPLTTEARHLLPGEACGFQTALDDPRAGEGGKGGPGPRTGRHGSKQLGLPHLRVFGRGKAIQEPGIHLALQGFQPFGGIAKVQVQGDAFAQVQTVNAADGIGPQGAERL